MLSMFGLEKLCLLNKTWIYPCNPSLHLHGQIGAACGKNSCLFSEIDKSIQITECKSHLKTAGKIHSAPLSLTLTTSPSNEFQLPVPLSHAASFSSCRHCWNCPLSQHLQNVSLESHCLSHGEQGGKCYVKEPSVEIIIDLTAWNSWWDLFSPVSMLTNFGRALVCQGRRALYHKGKSARNLPHCPHSSQGSALCSAWSWVWCHPLHCREIPEQMSL